MLFVEDFAGLFYRGQLFIRLRQLHIRTTQCFLYCFPTVSAAILASLVNEPTHSIRKQGRKTQAVYSGEGGDVRIPRESVSTARGRVSPPHLLTIHTHSHRYIRELPFQRLVFSIRLFYHPCSLQQIHPGALNPAARIFGTGNTSLRRGTIIGRTDWRRLRIGPEGSGRVRRTISWIGSTRGSCSTTRTYRTWCWGESRKGEWCCSNRRQDGRGEKAALCRAERRRVAFASTYSVFFVFLFVSRDSYEYVRRVERRRWLVSENSSCWTDRLGGSSRGQGR